MRASPDLECGFKFSVGLREKVAALVADSAASKIDQRSTERDLMQMIQNTLTVCAREPNCFSPHAKRDLIKNLQVLLYASGALYAVSSGRAARVERHIADAVRSAIDWVELDSTRSFIDVVGRLDDAIEVLC